MHLSMISDSYLSDAIDDAAGADATGAMAHRNGLLRGLAMMVIASALLGLTILSTGFHAAEADTRHCGGAGPEKAQAAVWWETNGALAASPATIRRSAVVSQTGTSVSLVALRQRFRSTCR